MRALKISLYSPHPFALPLAYNHAVQGLLYSCWKDAFPELHDCGYGKGGSRLRMFSFGPLEGAHSIRKESKEIVFDGLVSFEVRALDEELLDELAGQLAARGKLRIESNVLDLCNLETRDRLLFPARARIRMRSAVTLHRTIDDAGHTEFIGPDDPRFCELCRQNLRHKMEALGIGETAGCGTTGMASYTPDAADTLQIIPLSETIRKRVTKFKGTYISAWAGQFIMAADAQPMALLYHTGLGDRNSQGFGMFDIDDRPL